MFSLMSIFGTIALVSGSVGYLFFPMGLSTGIRAAINLAENGMVYPLYMNPPFAAQSTFYLYAITNPREVLRGGKMSLQVKGPYKFETYLVRENIAFSKQGDRVKYDSSRKMAPNEAKSADFDEKMWLLNPILPGAMKTIRAMVVDRVPFQSLSEPIVFNAVNLLLDNFKERLITKSSPRDLLIGRKVELLESLTGLANRFGLGSLIPPGPPENVFGLTFVQNRTIDNIEIWTGVGSTRDKFGEVFKWKNKSKMDVWRGKCNAIEGTNGELFKPLIEEGESIRAFLGPLCRSLYFDPIGEGTVSVPELGLRVLEYEFSPRTFWGARNNPDNKCFCEKIKSYECQYDGLIAMGPCFFDSPIYMSQGNFKGVDERIKRTVDYSSIRATPVPDLQKFSIEPITGSVVKVNLTIMALVKMVKQPYMRDLANVQNLTYAPLFATTETVTVPFKYVWQVYVLQKFNDYHKPIMAGLAASGMGMLVFKFIYL